MLQLLRGHCPSSLRNELDTASRDAPEEPRSLEKLLALCSVDSAPLAHGNRLLTTQASANLLVDVFQEQLMEDFAPASAASSGSVVDWRTAAGMNAVSPLLYDAFPAAALIMAGFRDQSQALRSPDRRDTFECCDCCRTHCAIPQKACPRRLSLPWSSSRS